MEGGWGRLSTRPPSRRAGSLRRGWEGKGKRRKKKKKGRGEGWKKKRGGRERGGGLRCSHPHDGRTRRPQLGSFCYCLAARRAPIYPLPSPAPRRAPRPATLTNPALHWLASGLAPPTTRQAPPPCARAQVPLLPPPHRGVEGPISTSARSSPHNTVASLPTSNPALAPLISAGTGRGGGRDELHLP